MLDIIKRAWLTAFLWSPLSSALKALLGDVLHQKLAMWPRIGYWPHIRDPRSFNEKVMHRKLFTDDPRFATVSDKVAVREFVRKRVGEEVLAEVYQITDDPDEIQFDRLPDEFVVKPTHGSGWVRIVEDVEGTDPDEIRSQCQEWLEQDFDPAKGEYWYDEIEHRILIEELLPSDDGLAPRDYKFFVFEGGVEYVQVDFDRFSEHTRRFYDSDWVPQEFTLKFPMGPEIPEPDRLDEMVAVAEQLGADFDFVRVDLYDTPVGVKFGELTVAPGSGGEQFDPLKYDMVLGNCWELINE